MNMNHVKAIQLLELDETKKITLSMLKKKYHQLALKNHPDKNGNTSQSNEKFQEINEAYQFLKREIKYVNLGCEQEMEPGKEEETTSSTMYYDILHLFLKNIFKESDLPYGNVLSNIINKIIFEYSTIQKKVSHKLFDELDKDTSMKIYSFLSKYSSILHLSQELLEEIRQIIIKKYDKLQIYKLNPSITDLLQNNIYKLQVENRLYLVPLWYNEHYFDGSGCEIMVLCEPELEEHIHIDDNNNLHVKLNLDFISLKNNILYETPLEVTIGPKTVTIPISLLYMKREQSYVIQNQGLAKEKENIYDVEERADIIVKVVFY